MRRTAGNFIVGVGAILQDLGMAVRGPAKVPDGCLSNDDLDARIRGRRARARRRRVPPRPAE